MEDGSLKYMLTPHRRFNPLTREWVLVSPQRTSRPWQGQVEDAAPAKAPQYDPGCYLCPGNARAGGVRNPAYESTFVFENDFAALRSDTPVERTEQGGLLIAESEPGICRVVCFSPRHDLTIANMDQPDLRHVVDEWVRQFADLGARKDINYVQIFENRGAMMGASNPHPHGQIWASHSLPNEVVKEQQAQEGWLSARGQCLLCEYAALEQGARERIVDENDSYLSLTPYWATWPFEIMILAKRHVTAIDQLTNAERDQLAGILNQVTARYDRLFQVSFPYTMGFHQRPTDGENHEEWHMHLHFYPPLLRSATVRKFMVGYEMLATPQRDITPEAAAERLRSV
ncbi:MAG TPA: UDP-glucose--hexose-1-phosphate uridylyltransferase [Bryobacteraceae bacterium]|nr:UDP-glucose--hexose-1-phosphate uridylyltransferase [Bryobacteraceae bacterium]